MSDTVQLAVGDKYTIPHLDSSFEIEITKLTPLVVQFAVSGDGVNEPETPRTMPMAAFVRWLEAVRKAEANDQN